MRLQPTARSGIQCHRSPQPKPTHSAVRPSTTPASPNRASRRLIVLSRSGQPGPPRTACLPDEAHARASLGGRDHTFPQHGWRSSRTAGASGAQTKAFGRRRAPSGPAARCRAGRYTGSRTATASTAPVPSAASPTTSKPSASSNARAKDPERRVRRRRWSTISTTHRPDRPTGPQGMHCGQPQPPDHREPRPTPMPVPAERPTLNAGSRRPTTWQDSRRELSGLKEGRMRRIPRLLLGVMLTMIEVAAAAPIRSGEGSRTRTSSRIVFIDSTRP